MAVTRTNGGDKDDRRRRERRGRREWRRVCVCVRARVFACLHVCPIVRALDTRAARLVRPPIPGLPGTRATTAWPHCPRLCVDTWIEGYSLVGGVEMLLHASGEVHDSLRRGPKQPQQREITNPAARRERRGRREWLRVRVRVRVRVLALVRVRVLVLVDVGAWKSQR